MFLFSELTSNFKRIFEKDRAFSGVRIPRDVLTLLCLAVRATADNEGWGSPPVLPPPKQQQQRGYGWGMWVSGVVLASVVAVGAWSWAM